MHNYSAPLPSESNYNASYFPSVFHNQTESNSMNNYQQQQYHDSEPNFAWCDTPYGLITPPQFNIAFPTRYPPVQPQARYQTAYQPQPHYLPIPSPPLTDYRRSSICSLPSPIPTTIRSTSINAQFHLEYEQSVQINNSHNQTQWSPSNSFQSSLRTTAPTIAAQLLQEQAAKHPSNRYVQPQEPVEKTRTPFITKLIYLLDNPDLFGDVIRWDPSGTSFLLTPSAEFTGDVLPTVFSHSSVPAFTRQLNTYGFIRINRAQLLHVFKPAVVSAVPVKALSAWYHPLFTRDNPSTMNRLGPKQTLKRKESVEIKNDSSSVEFSFINSSNEAMRKKRKLS